MSRAEHGPDCRAALAGLKAAPTMAGIDLLMGEIEGQAECLAALTARQLALLLRLASRVGGDRFRLELVCRLARQYTRQGDWNRAEKLLLRAEHQARGLGATFEPFWLYNSLGNLSIRRNHPRRAWRCLHIAQEIACGLAPVYRANVLNSLGGFHLSRQHGDRAKGLLLEALQIAEQINHTTLQAHVHANLGTYYAFRGDWERALGHYQSALPHYLSSGARRDEAICRRNLAAVLRELGAWEDAEDELARARSIASEEGDGWQVAWADLERLAQLLVKDQPRTALVLAHKVLARLTPLQDRLGSAMAQVAIGEAQMRLGQIEEAREQLEGAQAVLRRVAPWRPLADCEKALARLALALGRPRNARQHLQAAIEIFRAAGDRSAIAEARADLALLPD